jgi:hypothetical protein
VAVNADSGVSSVCPFRVITAFVSVRQRFSNLFFPGPLEKLLWVVADNLMIFLPV